MDIRTAVEYAEAQAAFAKLPNVGSRKRAQLTRKLHFIVSGDTALHFLNHKRRNLQQFAPQLDAEIDAWIAEHAIFGEFDGHPSTIWRWFGSRPFIQTTTSYAVHRLRVAVASGKRYDEIPPELVARPLDGNTMGGRSKLGKRSSRIGRGSPGPRKTEDLSSESYKLLAEHRAKMDALEDERERAAYARALGFIRVTLADDTLATVHLATACVPSGFKGYVQWPAEMTLEKLLRAGPGIDPATYTIAIDTRGWPLIPVNERIDLAQLVWLIGHGHGDGLHRGNVLERLKAAPHKRAFRWRDDNRLNCRLANLMELSRE